MVHCVLRVTRAIRLIHFGTIVCEGDILELFHKLVEYARTWFPENPDALGIAISRRFLQNKEPFFVRVGVFVPLELLVLGVLKVLGRGLDFHELELGVSLTSCIFCFLLVLMVC